MKKSKEAQGSVNDSVFFHEFWTKTTNELGDHSAFHFGNLSNRRYNVHKTISTNIKSSELEGLNAIVGTSAEVYFSGLTASLALLLYRYAGYLEGHHIVIDTPLYKKNVGAKRNNAKIPLVIGVDSGRSLLDLLETINDRIKATYLHQNLPPDFSSIERVKTNVLVCFDEIHCDPQDRSQYDLIFDIKRRPDSVQIETSYSNIVPEDLSAEIAGKLSRILQAWHAPDMQVRSIEIVSEDQQLLLSSTFYKSPHSYDPNATIISKFIEHAQACPDKIAIVFKDKALTYGELYQQSMAIADWLKSNFKLSEGDVVGVYLERSEASVVALLALMMAGAIYLPIDVEFQIWRFG